MVSAGPHLYSIGAGGAGGEGAGRGGGGANRRSATAAAAPHDRRIFFKIFLIKQIIKILTRKYGDFLKIGIEIECRDILI